MNRVQRLSPQRVLFTKMDETDCRNGVVGDLLRSEVRITFLTNGQRVPEDLVTKEGPQRKMLFITALLPVILEVNQRVLAEREQLIFLRGKMGTLAGLTPTERMWLEQLANRYDTSSDKLDELLRRVDIVPPSMAIAQGGVESGWGTSAAARTNALFGMVSSGGKPLPFSNVGEAANAYVANLNTHGAYAAFRAERAPPDARRAARSATPVRRIRV